MLEPVFGFDGRGFIRLRDQIWPMVIEQAVADGLPGLITTFVFERSLPQDMVPNVRDHVVEKGGAVRFVQLVCDKTENDRRLASPERTRFRKMTSADELNRILESGHFTTPTGLGGHADTRHDAPERRTSRRESLPALGLKRGRGQSQIRPRPWGAPLPAVP